MDVRYTFRTNFLLSIPGCTEHEPNLLITYSVSAGSGDYWNGQNWEQGWSAEVDIHSAEVLIGTETHAVPDWMLRLLGNDKELETALLGYASDTDEYHRDQAFDAKQPENGALLMAGLPPCPTCGAPRKRPKVEPTTALGKRRAELGLSLQQVANLAGITKAQVWEIERGNSNPRMSTIAGLAKALDWQVITLLVALASDSNSDPKGGDALAAPCEASQSGRSEASASPKLPHPPHPGDTHES